MVRLSPKFAPQIKICGLSTTDTAATAISAGASMIGFVFFANSPRYVSAAAANSLMAIIPDEVTVVGLFVDPDDALLEDVLNHIPLDMIQLHGNETAERCHEIKTQTGLPVMKAIGISSATDITRAQAFEGHVDYLLFDAKPEIDDTRPGGLGRSFDWSLLQAWNGSTPWLLSGGLTPENIADAINQSLHISGFTGVDVSSGVESAPGKKEPKAIAAFISAASAAIRAAALVKAK